MSVTEQALTPELARRGTAGSTDPSLAYSVASSNECALAARQLGVQTAFLAQVLVDSGVVQLPPRLAKRSAAKFIRRRAAVIGPNDPISLELNEIADQLEAT